MKKVKYDNMTTVQKKAVDSNKKWGQYGSSTPVFQGFDKKVIDVDGQKIQCDIVDTVKENGITCHSTIRYSYI